MARGISSSLLVLLAIAGLVTGCRLDFDDREPWRAEAEEKCIAEKGVVPSAYLEPLSAIDGSGTCGMEHPFQVHAFADGNVIMEPTGKLACPVIHEIDLWIDQTVQPAAMAWLGQQVVAIRQMSAYSCRTMNGQAGAKISEHAFGNALDVGAFKLADGRWITVKNGWKGTPEERGFLLQVQAGACERFTTVLAPGSNVFHYDHIHVDLMRHAKGRTICKPAPRPMPAPAMRPPMIAVAPPAEGPAERPASYPPQAEPVRYPAPSQPPLPEPEPEVARSPAPAPAYEPAAYPPQQDLPPRPRPGLMPPASLPGRPAQGAPQEMPPGWIVGPQGVSPGPMSYAASRGSAKSANPLANGPPPARRYYTVPIPQASPIPLPLAKPGED